MVKKSRTSHQAGRQGSVPERNYHGRIFSIPGEDKFLDTVQLNRLEHSFREWTNAAARVDVGAARRRILLIFLIIRYTGAKLNEVLNLDPVKDFDFETKRIVLSRQKEESGRAQRKVHIPEKLGHEIRTLLPDPLSKSDTHGFFHVDPAFVRRKFYERAEACGIAKQLGAPEILRKSRAIELMQNNLPLPAVQAFLGHSTPNLTSAYVSFSQDDIEQVTRIVLEKESARKTSARNSFFGKIKAIEQGDIQTLVKIATLGGQTITTVITNDSLQRLGLKAGKMITAEVKAPWVMLHTSGHGQGCSADNRLNGLVVKISRGKINTEYVVRTDDGTEVCSIVTSESSRRLSLAQGDQVWVVFSSYSVVLLSE